MGSILLVLLSILLFIVINELIEKRRSKRDFSASVSAFKGIIEYQLLMDLVKIEKRANPYFAGSFSVRHPGSNYVLTFELNEDKSFKCGLWVGSYLTDEFHLSKRQTAYQFENIKALRPLLMKLSSFCEDVHSGWKWRDRGEQKCFVVPYIVKNNN